MKKTHKIAEIIGTIIAVLLVVLLFYVHDSREEARLMARWTGDSTEENDAADETSYADDDSADSGELSSSSSSYSTEDEDAWQKLVMDGFIAIYNSEFKDENDSFIEDYDAWGNTMIILHEDNEEIRYLLYDRESDNGKCGQYVYYRAEKNEDGLWSQSDAAILNMYAYVYKSGDVIVSEKTDWGDEGTQEYINATEN